MLLTKAHVSVEDGRSYTSAGVVRAGNMRLEAVQSKNDGLVQEAWAAY